MLDNAQKSSKFLPEIIAMVSSANSMGFDTEFILSGVYEYRS